EHFFHADEVASVAIPGGSAYHFEIEIGISQIWLILTQVADHAAGPGDWPGAAPLDGILPTNNPDSLQPVDENAIPIQPPADNAMSLAETGDEVADHPNPLIIHVAHQPADARITRMKPLAGRPLRDVVNLLALVERIEKSGERAEVEGRGADIE